MGIERGTAGTKAQTNPLSYGSTLIKIKSYNDTLRIFNQIFKVSFHEFEQTRFYLISSRIWNHDPLALSLLP